MPQEAFIHFHTAVTVYRTAVNKILSTHEGVKGRRNRNPDLVGSAEKQGEHEKLVKFGVLLSLGYLDPVFPQLAAGESAVLQRHARHRLRAVRRAEAWRYDAGVQRPSLRHARRGDWDTPPDDGECLLKKILGV